MVQRCSQVGRNVCLSEGGKRVTIEMARKILCFSKVIVMPACKVLLSAMGRETSTFRSTETECGRSTRRSQHGLSDTGVRSKGQIMKCSMCYADKLKFYF